MLTLTDDAVVAIRTLTDGRAVSDEGGLRIDSDAVGSLTLSLAAGPSEGDQVVEDSGARLFLAPVAARALDDKALDATIERDGSVQFAVADQTSGDDGFMGARDLG
jgi:Fe-S cluster assembly iron-binding protein IscA